MLPKRGRVLVAAPLQMDAGLAPPRLPHTWLPPIRPHCDVSSAIPGPWTPPPSPRGTCEALAAGMRLALTAQGAKGWGVAALLLLLRGSGARLSLAPLLQPWGSPAEGAWGVRRGGVRVPPPVVTAGFCQSWCGKLWGERRRRVPLGSRRGSRGRGGCQGGALAVEHQRGAGGCLGGRGRRLPEELGAAGGVPGGCRQSRAAPTAGVRRPG